MAFSNSSSPIINGLLDTMDYLKRLYHDKNYNEIINFLSEDNYGNKTIINIMRGYLTATHFMLNDRAEAKRVLMLSAQAPEESLRHMNITDAVILLVRSNLDKGLYEQVIQACDLILEVLQQYPNPAKDNPIYVSVYTQKSQAHKSLQQDERANESEALAAKYQQLTEAKSDHPTYFRQSNEALERKDYQQALNYINKAIQLNKEKDDYYVVRAKAYRGLGENTKANMDCDTALQLNFLNGNAHAVKLQLVESKATKKKSNKAPEKKSPSQRNTPQQDMFLATTASTQPKTQPLPITIDPPPPPIEIVSLAQSASEDKQSHAAAENENLFREEKQRTQAAEEKRQLEEQVKIQRKQQREEEKAKKQQEKQALLEQRKQQIKAKQEKEQEEKKQQEHQAEIAALDAAHSFVLKTLPQNELDRLAKLHLFLRPTNTSLKIQGNFVLSCWAFKFGNERITSSTFHLLADSTQNEDSATALDIIHAYGFKPKKVREHSIDFELSESKKEQKEMESKDTTITKYTLTLALKGYQYCFNPARAMRSTLDFSSTPGPISHCFPISASLSTYLIINDPQDTLVQDVVKKVFKAELPPEIDKKSGDSKQQNQVSFFYQTFVGFYDHLMFWKKPNATAQKILSLAKNKDNTWATQYFIFALIKAPLSHHGINSACFHQLVPFLRNKSFHLETAAPTVDAVCRAMIFTKNPGAEPITTDNIAQKFQALQKQIPLDTIAKNMALILQRYFKDIDLSKETTADILDHFTKVILNLRKNQQQLENPLTEPHILSLLEKCKTWGKKLSASAQEFVPPTNRTPAVK